MDDLLKIEVRLGQEGDTQRVRRAFWRIVGKIKRQDATQVSTEIITKTAEIRNRLFKKNVVISLNHGLLIFAVGAVITFGVFIWINLFLVLDLLWMNIALFLVIFVTLYCQYPLGRYLGGIIAGVGFEGFYRYSPGEFGLKIEYISYLKTTRRRRKWVFGGSIIWISLLLLIKILLVFLLNPPGLWTPLVALLFYFLLLLALYRFSKTGELYRFIREFKIEREVKRQRRV